MLTRVFVLGLLSFKPMTGYTIQHYLRLNRAEQWASILPGSIHYALKKLAEEGFVTLQATEQTGYRTKVIYAITPTGKEEFHRLLKQLWSTAEPHYPAGLYAALTFLNVLPREQVLAALDAHIAALQSKIEIWNRGEATQAVEIPREMREFVRLSFANGREHMEVDLRFLRLLRERLPSLPSVEEEQEE